MTGQQQQTDGNGTDTKPPKVEFTPEQHEEINRIVAARTSEAARKAAADRQAEIDAYLAAQKAEAEKAEMAEIDRLKAEQAEAAARAEAAEQARLATEQRAAALTALHAANVDPNKIDYALRLIDTAADDITTEVKTLADNLPALFQTPPPAPPGPPSLNPGGNDQRHAGGRTFEERGRDALAAAGIHIPDPAA